MTRLVEKNGGVDEEVVNDGYLWHDGTADNEDLRSDFSEHVDVGIRGVGIGHEQVRTAMEHRGWICPKLHRAHHRLQTNNISGLISLA